MKTEYPFYEIEHELSTVRDVIGLTEKSYRENPVFCYKEGKEIKNKSKKEFLSDIERMETLFHNFLDIGSHIAILGKTSYEWVISYFAAMCSENIAVPLDKELSAEDLKTLIHFADVNCLIFDKEYQDVAKQLSDDKSMNIQYICMHEVAGFSGLNKMLSEIDTMVLWKGNPIPEDVAEIVFTSGTTGKSKGCMITHQNLAWNVMNGSSFTDLKSKDKILSILPVNHALEITAGIMTPMYCGVTVCINESLKYLRRNLLIYRPQCMVVVPLVLRTLYKDIWKEIEKGKQGLRVKVAMKMAQFLKKCHIDIRRKLFKQILEPLGGDLCLMVCGGAYLEPQIIKDFEAWGINIVQGYGITECAPVVTCNTDRYKKYDSVGKVVTGCDVKIIEDEICVRGPIVMKGYYKDQEATDELFKGEWFKTGDMGYLDKDGYLYITGRKKNLIILSNGENVAPEELEQKIMCFAYVKEVLISEVNGQICAEVFLDKEIQPDAEVKIQEDITALNKQLPNYKKIGKTIIRNQEFEKTSTRKIKRKY